jgi:hypothetical protein
MNRPKLPPFRLSEVSDARKEFLLRWQMERKLDLELREVHADHVQAMVAEHGFVRYGDADSVRLFDTEVHPGDIRLLSMGDVPDDSRCLYVAVLFVRTENGTSVVVPFSPYGVPGCKEEWLTGFAGEPLKVLQFWNAQPVATRDLAQSWKTDEVDEGCYEQMRKLYTHAIDGSWPQGDLRERVGLAILDPADERLAYQSEEIALFTRLRTRLFRHLEAVDTMPKRRVLFCKADTFRFADASVEQHAVKRLAADSGTVYANVVIQFPDGRTMQTRGCRDVDSGDHTVVWWRVEGCPEGVHLLPGQPACLYGAHLEQPLIAQGMTIRDGATVSFDLKDEETHERVMRSSTGLWIVIQAE